MSDTKSTAELLGEVLADERATSNRLREEHAQLTATFRAIAISIIEGAKAEGINASAGESVKSLYIRLMTKITDEREAGKVALIKASELPLSPPATEPQAQTPEVQS